MKLSDLFEYDEKFGALQNTATRVRVNYDGEEWIIEYESTELNKNGHIHCGDLNSGIKQLVEIVIEKCIWETE